MALSSTAFGQGITDLTVAKNAANRVDATFSTTGPGTPQHFEVRSTVATESASPSAFTTRYRFVTGYDVDSVGGSVSLVPGLFRADYGIAFNVTAPGAYDLLVTTRLRAGFTLENDSVLGNSAQMTGVSGSQSGGTLSGSLELPDPPDLGGGDGGDYSVDETGPVATISGVSNGAPVAHRLDFSWLYRCFPASTVLDADACGIRGGLSTTVAGLASVASYPGVPVRDAADDGHIVEVTLISYCGDGVVQAEKGEVCDEGAANGGVSCCSIDCTLAPSGATCRNAAGGCDVVETCDGVDTACPADVIATGGATCRASAGSCDPAETCDGTTTACPADAKSTAQCRASTDQCDPAEICDGVADDCPADVLLSDGTDCEDDAFCNGVQACTGGVCGGGVNPCPTTLCDEASHTCFVGGCPIVPRVCGAAAKNKLLLKNRTDDAKDKLVWKWSNGTATTQEQFGDPVVDADYALCFYAGATPTLIEKLSVPAGGGKWSASGSKGYKYIDPSAANGGVSSIILKGGDDGRTKAMVKGKGLNLPDFDSLVPVPASDLPLIVQLRNNATDRCWAGSFANPKQLGQFNGTGTP